MLNRVPFIGVAAILLLQLPGCNREPVAFKPIQQQRSGDYVVLLMNDTGMLKQHAGHLRLEFRNASSNELANVSNVRVETSMKMQGMGPMFGNVSSLREVSSAQYDFDTEFSMTGLWNFLVTFQPNGRVQFNVNAQ
jgi:hypothetical protein